MPKGTADATSDDFLTDMPKGTTGVWDASLMSVPMGTVVVSDDFLIDMPKGTAGVCDDSLMSMPTGAVVIGDRLRRLSAMPVKPVLPVLGDLKSP